MLTATTAARSLLKPQAAAKLAARSFAIGAHLDDSEYSHFSLKLTDEQREFQQLARKFAREEMIPKEKYHDTTMEFPQEIFGKAWELGLVNTHVPEVRLMAYSIAFVVCYAACSNAYVCVLLCAITEIRWSRPRCAGRLHHR